jgi:hypothetical protein
MGSCLIGIGSMGLGAESFGLGKAADKLGEAAEDLGESISKMANNPNATKLIPRIQMGVASAKKSIVETVQGVVKVAGQVYNGLSVLASGGSTLLGMNND